MELFKPLLGNNPFNGYSTRVLTDDSAEEVQAFLEICKDYKLLKSGTIPLSGDGLVLIRDLPPGRSLEDKVVFSLDKDNTMVAIVDILKDHPKKDIWWIGLMLIHPQFRNNGLGTQILDTIIDLLKTRSIPEIRIGDLEENSSAMHFWERQGFRVIESLPGRIFGKKTHTLYVMKLEN